MSYHKKYYQKHKEKYKKGGKYYKYKTKGDDSKGLIINRGKFIVYFN